MSALDRLEAFKQSDEERSSFMKDLFDKNTTLLEDLKIAKGDLTHEITSRRMLQDRVQDAEAKLKDTQDSAVRQTLSDPLSSWSKTKNLAGQRGAVGGSEAAHRLLDNIKHYVQHYDGSTTWKILVRVYTNLEGLLAKYSYIGFHEEASSLRPFVAGFTQSQPLFDYVDAGYGKERADHKVKAHDNGYVPTLDAFKNNPTVASRISLLKPISKGREYNGLPFDVASFESIFRKDDLPHDRPYGKHPRTLPPPRQPPPFTPVPMRKRATGKDLIKRRPIYPGPVWLNKDNQRVDEDLGEPSEKGLATLESL
ncbi:MAG: hypothetical protein Q9228_005706, partial [Teloschistes exilis]